MISRERLERVIHDALDEFVGSGSGTYSVTDAVMAALTEDAELEAIVRGLAALECPVSTIVSEVTGDVAGLCPTCGATLTSDFRFDIEPHDDDCVYRRAVEWVAAHPAEETM